MNIYIRHLLKMNDKINKLETGLQIEKNRNN